MNKKILVIFFVFLGILFSCGKDGENTQISLENNEQNMNENFSQTDTPKNGDLVAIIKTSNGTMKIRLFLDKAPKTVLNFVGLTQKGYYKDLIFHRVMKDFMIQGGDPKGNGTGGESYWGGEFEDEFSSDLSNIRGALSMANSGPNTNGSQFFIVHKDATYLDNKHSVFGQVYEGLDTLDKIAKVKVGDANKPEKDVKIISVDIKKFNKGLLEDTKIDVDTELKTITDKKAEQNKDREVKNGDMISVEYTGKLENGDVFDSSIGRQPLVFTVGAGQLIKGFDSGVVGMKIGDKKTLTILPEEGYGDYDDALVQEIRNDELVAAGIPLEVGTPFNTVLGPATIIEVNNETNKVKVDFNHGLVGKTLVFEVELIYFQN